jgi:hypothetical protein
VAASQAGAHEQVAAAASMGRAAHERLGRGARTSDQTTTFIATMAKLERIRIKTVTEGEI